MGGSLPSFGAEFSVNPGSLQSERHFGKMTKLCLQKKTKQNKNYTVWLLSGVWTQRRLPSLQTPFLNFGVPDHRALPSRDLGAAGAEGRQGGWRRWVPGGGSL